MSPDTERWLRIVGEVVGLALTAYMVWLIVPESVKIELRGLVRQLDAPRRAAEAQRRARVEMMSDVIELGTFGPPVQWVREQPAA